VQIAMFGAAAGARARALPRMGDVLGRHGPPAGHAKGPDFLTIRGCTGRHCPGTANIP